jgi:NAD(P)-dependent dehydrogenase (short-subunit alcohol dehydrogenase family)
VGRRAAGAGGVVSRLAGKVALVTGGASGIGEATVRLFVAEGASVVIADLQDERGGRVAGELGARAAYAHADVSREADVQAAVEAAVRRFGRLDCIFNNAGYGGVGGRIAEIPVEGFDETLGVLLRGVFLGMKHAAPVMRRQGGGSIISTASIAGLRTGLGPHVYSAAKAAVIHLTRSVAMELGEHNIRVNCICPGGIATPIFGKGLGLSPERAEEIVPLMKGVLENLQPIRRAGLPEDIAQAALWLASDDSTFVNGHALVVDGGLSGGRSWSESQFRRAALRQALGLTEA